MLKRMLKVLRREEGASAVEFALLCPLLFMLIFGIITFGLSFMQLQSARNGVREGARCASVLRSDATTRGCNPNIPQITSDASTGVIPSGEVKVVPCGGPTGQATVSWQAHDIKADLIFFTVDMNPNAPISASFLCEG